MREMKDSGVPWIGNIPKGWEMNAIKHCFTVVSGGTPDTNVPMFWNGDIPWVTPANYKTEEHFVSKGDRFLTKKGLDSCGASLIPSGSIIFSKRAPIGSVAICNNNLSTNQGCLACIPKKAVSHFFYYAFIANKDYFELLGSGTTFKEISITSFCNYRLPVPNLIEQQRIADFLDSKCAEINSILERTRESIDGYKKLKQSVITEAVTKGIRRNRPMIDSGSVWFSSIPINWDFKRLKYLFRIEKRIAGETGHTVLAITQRGVLPKNMDYGNGQFAEDYSNYQLVNPGDFAMNHMDLLTGWVDISRYSGVTSPDYRVFTITDKAKCHPAYYLYFMQMCYMDRIFYGLGQGVSGMGRWRLQADKFLNFRIPVPPMEEQQEIANYLDEKCAAIDSLIASKEALITELEAYKKSLIYEYVTGKKEC